MSQQIVGYIERTANAGETFDALALAAYNEETMATYIIKANPDLSDVVTFEGGSRPLRPPKRSPRGGAHENLIPRRRHHRERQRQPVLPRYVRGEARRRARDPLQ